MLHFTLCVGKIETRNAKGYLRDTGVREGSKVHSVAFAIHLIISLLPIFSVLFIHCLKREFIS